MKKGDAGYVYRKTLRRYPLREPGYNLEKLTGSSRCCSSLSHRSLGSRRAPSASLLRIADRWASILPSDCTQKVSDVSTDLDPAHVNGPFAGC